jgi:enoyl-CoA hydratase
MYNFLQLRRDGPVLIATMSNPPKNFLNAPMVAELHALADALKDDAEVRSLILTGGVEGIFITHYDVGELTVLSDASRKRPAETTSAPAELHTMHRLILKLQALPQPVIAAINGTAMGGGCELAIGCDFRYMSTDGVIGCPEVRVGILPGAGGTQRITRLVGVAKAMELMLLGDAVNAVTAERIGLVHRALPPEELLPEAVALAHELASRPPLSVALIKQCILQGSELPLEEALRFEQEAFFQTIRSDDAARIMRAYLQSNRPLNEQ